MAKKKRQMAKKKASKQKNKRNANKKGPYKFTEERKKLWLEAFKKTHNVSAACEAVHIGRTVAYKYREIDDKFRDDWDAIENRVLDVVESVLYKKALEGETPCLFFLLCNRRSEKWKHRGEVEHRGKIQTEEINGARQQLENLLKQDEDGKKFIEKWRELLRSTDTGKG